MRKYIILFGSLLLLAILAFSFPFKKESDGYRVNVELTNVPDNLIHISLKNLEKEQEDVKEFTGETSIDICFTGSVQELSFFSLSIYEIREEDEEKRLIQHLNKRLFINNEEVTIKGEIDSIEVITNSETQKVLEQWNKEANHILEPLSNVKSKLFEAYKKGAFETESYKDNLAVYRDLIAQEKDAVAGFISRNKNSKTAAFLLNLYHERLPLDTVQELYRTLGETIKQSKYNDPIEIYITTEVLDIGDNWKGFRAFNTKGDSILLSEVEKIADKYMLLAFARRGCIPCEKSISELKDIYKKYRGKLEIVTYYSDISVEALKSKAERNDIEWTFLGTKESDHQTLRSYGAKGVPKFVLISPERKIIYSRKLGYEKGTLTEKVEEYLGR